jgi:hypothetical protein
MEPLLKSDIFFFITAISVIILTLVLITVFFYVMKILRDIKEISRIAKDQSVKLSEDVDRLRVKMAQQEFSWGSIFKIITGLFKRKGRS